MYASDGLCQRVRWEPDMPRTQRITRWCSAEPGPILIVGMLGPGSAQQRHALQRVRDTCGYFEACARALRTRWASFLCGAAANIGCGLPFGSSQI